MQTPMPQAAVPQAQHGLLQAGAMQTGVPPMRQFGVMQSGPPPTQPQNSTFALTLECGYSNKRVDTGTFFFEKQPALCF